MTCSATQQGDEMACGRCALRWDVADPLPPLCLQHERRTAPRGAGLPPMPTRPLVTVVPCRVGRAFPDGAVFEPAAPSAPPAPAVDYRELLLKYMRHMLRKEGSTGAGWIGVEGRGYFSDVLFSPEEVVALKACADELAGG